MRYKLFSVFFTQIVMWVLLILMLFPQTWILSQWIRILFSCILLLYLPWFRVWYIFFWWDSLSALERFITNFLISVSLVILVSYYLFYSANSISSIKIYIITSILIIISIFIVLIRWRWYPYVEFDTQFEEWPTPVH